MTKRLAALAALVLGFGLLGTAPASALVRSDGCGPLRTGPPGVWRSHSAPCRRLPCRPRPVETGDSVWHSRAVTCVPRRFFPA